MLRELFGRGNSPEQLELAQQFVEQNRYSGLTRHYDMEAVQENIQSFTSVKVSKSEARNLVNTVRSQNGWEPASHL